MLKIILLRHAKSSWAQGGQTDFDRPLNERGETDCQDLSQRILARGIRPQRVLSSPAARASQTAHLMTRGLGLSPDTLVCEQRLYLAEPGDLLSVVREQDAQFATLMLVAHNPGITQFSNRLCDHHLDNMPTCSYTHLSLDTNSWSELDWGQGKLVYFDWPKNRELD